MCWRSLNLVATFWLCLFVFCVLDYPIPAALDKNKSLSAYFSHDLASKRLNRPQFIQTILTILS